MRGALDTAGSFVLFPLLCYAFVFILSVEIPDLEGDLLGGKRNWITRIGRRLGFIAIGLFLLVATGWFFFASRFYTSHIPINFGVIGALSLLPLLPGVWGLLRRPTERQSATQITTTVVIALSIFSILMDVYLFVLIASPNF
jgi:1,4-dihydroxy-2-naphthoate octaprenyltransferase